VLKENLPPEGGIKNNNNTNNDVSTSSRSTENENTKKENSKKIEIYTKQEEENNTNNSRLGEISINEDITYVNEQKNSASLGPENFQYVTPSHVNCHIESKTYKHEIPKNVIEGILKIIREENGTISLGYALQIACQKSEVVKDFLKDEKLSSRESRKVRNLFVEIIRHSNIKAIKNKPKLDVKWIET